MKNRYFTKFCGITNIKDAINAQNAGCDALGFVFVKKSKRYIDVETCQKIINKLSPCILKVALLANNNENEIQETINQCGIHVLQFHGSESPEFCQQWELPYWKAIPMADGVNPLEYANLHPLAQAYLIDNYGANHAGGSGHKFDWKKLPPALDSKWILAGGLTIKNIKKARNNASLRCFDVSTGIEKSPGIKSNKKMKKFIKRLND